MLGPSFIGQFIANVSQRGTMWAIQSIIVITKILPLIFGSIQSSVHRAPTFGSAQQVQTTLLGLLLMVTQIQGLALVPVVNMQDMNAQMSITLPTTNATLTLFKTEGQRGVIV